MSSPEFSNPLVYAQFNMRGGWKNTLIVAGGYGLLLGGAIAATAYASDNHSATFARWTVGLLVIQSLTLCLYGAGRVSAVVRADVKSGLMESHRLMPTSPYAVVAGYVLGAPVQALFLAGVTFLIGVLICPAGQVDLSRWAVANLMLFAFSFMGWMVTMQLALGTKGGLSVLVLGLFVGVSANGAVLLLPATSVLLCPLVGRSIFSLRDSFADFSFQYVVALLGQAAIGAVCFLAAVRRYRRPEEPAFNVLLGLAVLAVTAALSFVGIVYYQDFHFGYERTEPSTQLIASIVLCMAAAMLPISAAARRRSHWQRDPLATANEKPRGSTLLTTLAAAVIVCSLLRLGAQVRRDDTGVAIALSIAEVTAALLGLAALLRWIYLAMNKAWFVVAIWIALVWVLPLVADVVHRAVQEKPDDTMGLIASLSPVGTLIILWTGRVRNVQLGVLFTVAIILLPLMLTFATLRRQRRRVANLDALVAR